MSIKETLIRNLKEKKAHVGILGLGYVGLPLAVVFAEAGFHVTGVDPDSRKVDSLKQGVSYIPDVKDQAVDGCRQHLRAHASAADWRPGYVVHYFSNRRTGKIHA